MPRGRPKGRRCRSDAAGTYVCTYLPSYLPTYLPTYIERPLRASPFEVAYVHPSVPRCRDKRSRKDGYPFSPLSLSLSLTYSLTLLLPLRPFLSASPFPSLSRRVARRYPAIRLVGRIDACVHALSRSGMTGERIQFPSSLSCLHLQLELKPMEPRSDHPR